MIQASTQRSGALSSNAHNYGRKALRLVPSRGSQQVCPAVKEIFMPALSSTMTEGKIVSWLKQEGDKVKKGEPVVVVESDKADMDVESFAEGVLAAVVVGEGERANVGAPIAFVAETDGEVAEAKRRAAAFGGAPAPAAAAPPPPPPATKAAPAPATAAVAAPPPRPPPPPPAAPAGRTDGRIIATPYAKQRAKELKVDLSRVQGSGPNGRITASDVESAAGTPAAAATPAAAPSVPAAAAPVKATAAAAAAPAAAPKSTTVSELRGTTKPLTALQQAVVRNMLESLKVPEFRVSYAIQTDKLDALYQKLKPSGVTMTALLAKAAGVALRSHPALFAVATPDGNGITYNANINVAVAVAMPDGGLITPVLKHADKTDIYQLSRNWADLVKRARLKQLQPDEFNSGTFTISNLGMYGVESFDAILPPGTAAILAVAGAKPTVVATEDGLIGVRKVMNVNLTADHRIVYGAQAAEFLQTLKAVIESPDQLLLA